MIEENRLLVVWDRVGDYHRARLRALRERGNFASVLSADLGSRDGLYSWTSEPDETHLLLSDKPVEAPDLKERYKRFCRVIREHRITHLALSGYGRWEYIFFLIHGKWKGLQTVLFAESWYPGNRWKDVLKGWLLRRAGVPFLVSGKRAMEHFNCRLGIAPERLSVPYSVVDNAHFRKGYRSYHEREPVVLAVARFSPEKGLDLLIEAFLNSRLRKTHRLRLIGGGPEKAALQALAGSDAPVEFLDWVSYAELPDHYGQAALFVLPSRFEPWGLVVNEAMAAGLPVLVSDAVGCAPDLVDSANGGVFRAGEVAALQSRLDAFAESALDHRSAMSECSLQRIESMGCSQWAQALERSVGIS
jgi:1,2-diacylglycerol 3-alpha-glucosyltransferase